MADLPRWQRLSFLPAGAPRRRPFLRRSRRARDNTRCGSFGGAIACVRVAARDDGHALRKYAPHGARDGRYGAPDGRYGARHLRHGGRSVQHVPRDVRATSPATSAMY